MDSVIFGLVTASFLYGSIIDFWGSDRNVCHTDGSGAYLARHVGHFSGVPVTVPALTVNRCVGLNGFCDNSAHFARVDSVDLGSSHSSMPCRRSDLENQMLS